MFDPVTVNCLDTVPPETENPSAPEVRDSPLTVLFVKLSFPARVDRVPEVGRVTLVPAVVVRVKAFAPEVVKEEAVVSAPPREVVCPLSSLAFTIPVPVKLKEPPLPKTIDAWVFVPDVMTSK